MRATTLTLAFVALAAALPPSIRHFTREKSVGRRDGTTEFDPDFALKTKRDGTTEFDPDFALKIKRDGTTEFDPDFAL
ncbi:hypothetical protein EV127DRAFT_484166 [Xylaria flabelliformis]|nr:hypothetical protein EV127DRAFT_484166 [Xylaria flabelliformis]